MTYFLAAVALYFVPLIIAAARHSRHALAISLITVFTGWLVIPWVICFIWAICDHVAQDDRHSCPSCGEKILNAARVCHYCQTPQAAPPPIDMSRWSARDRARYEGRAPAPRRIAWGTRDTVWAVAGVVLCLAAAAAVYIPQTETTFERGGRIVLHPLRMAVP